MNIQTLDILNAIHTKPFTNQRDLAKESGHSLGIVNRCIKELMEGGYIDEHMGLTNKAQKAFQENAPQNAIILAAGYGMRMVPINTEVPKGLLEVKGETLIERLIKQLHEAGIHNIFVVVGYMKEHYEYLSHYIKDHAENYGIIEAKDYRVFLTSNTENTRFNLKIEFQLK